MDTDELARELLAAYGTIAGLPGLKFDKNGCARLLFDHGSIVNLEIDRGAACLHLYGVLGPVPAGNQEALYRKLLEANFFGTRVGGASLAIDAVQEEILIGRRIDVAKTTATDFAQIIEAFAGVVRDWKQKVDSGELMPAARESASHDSGYGMYLRG
jgi:hypothetical protein